MSEVYVFSGSEEDNDYSTYGLVGALLPTECIFKEVINGESTLTMTHPLDSYGRYKALAVERILTAVVPVRFNPELFDDITVSVIWKYVVKDASLLTSVKQRKLYKKKSGSKSKAKMKPGDEVTVVQKPEDGTRWRASTKYGNGWVVPDALELVTEYTIDPEDRQAFQNLASYWSLRYQMFRIYKVEKTLTEIKVEARHISYDLLYNVTTFETELSTPLETTAARILQYCYLPHPFSALSREVEQRADLNFKNMNPIEAFLDTEKGLCALYGCAMLRDNYALVFVHEPGVNRGVRIEYSSNMKSIDYEANFDDIYNKILPLGETSDGKLLYLVDGEESGDADEHTIPEGRIVSLDDYVSYKASQGITITPPTYNVDRLYVLKCEKCKVGEKEKDGRTVTKAIARARMLDQAYKMFDTKCYEPKISMKVEMSDTYANNLSRQIAIDLGRCYLYDFVTVVHKDFNINQLVRITGMEWDCLLDRSKSIEIGDRKETLADLIKKVGGSK